MSEHIPAKHLPIAESQPDQPTSVDQPSDEYAIDARLFAATLHDQRATRQKGGLYHLTQVLMAYNTNRIEGSQLDQEQTRYIYETRTITGDGNVPLDDVLETVNSFQLFDALLDRVDEQITAQTMKDYHVILKSRTADSLRPSVAIGDWKRMPNVVGMTETVPPEHVELAIQDLLSRTPATGAMSFTDIVDFHHRFEKIHPFQDGNGRVGRALMFQQCLQNGIMPFIVLDQQKAFYYRGLSQYETEPGFLQETLRSFQDDYYARFSKFVERAPKPEKSARQLRLEHEITAKAAGLDDSAQGQYHDGLSL